MFWRPFIGGVALGTLGVKVLTSREAKVVYSHITAAALHCRDDIMATADTLQENCDDIYQRAKKLNEESKAYNEQMIKDAKAVQAESCTEA
ncbi:MAG: DUF6110 family protein [Lachnospiraceae bacterium]|nr:DUF6110 family protein [Lachnospiraceae bacterium]